MLSSKDSCTIPSCAHRFASLRGLDLSVCRVSDRELAELAVLTGLRGLSMQSCNGITDRGLLHLTALRGLTHLDLQNCCKVSCQTISSQCTSKSHPAKVVTVCTDRYAVGCRVLVCRSRTLERIT